MIIGFRILDVSRKTMRTGIITLLLVVFFASCRKEISLSLRHDNSGKMIALQPFEGYDSVQLFTLQRELHRFFKVDVRILKPIDLPDKFSIQADEMYRADSLLQYLIGLKRDAVTHIVGLTHKGIYSLADSKSSNHDGRSMAYWRSVRGLSFTSQPAALVSDYSFRSIDTALWQVRLRNAALHEIGHGLGLEHCNTVGCLMSETNGDIKVLSQRGRDFCKECRQQVN